MARPTPPELGADVARLHREQLAALGREVRSARRSRRWSQQELAARVGMHQSSISRVERGNGGSLSLAAWQRIGGALARPLLVQLGGTRAVAPPGDAASTHAPRPKGAPGQEPSAPGEEPSTA